jgi:LCP family protein required for cell wall assembly
MQQSAPAPQPGSQASRYPRPSPALAAFLSFLLPGLGQAYAGQRRRALLWALPTLVLFGALVVLVVAVRDPGYLVGLLIQPTWLLLILALDLAFLAYRIAAIVDAYRVAAGVRRGPGARRALRLGAIAMAGLVVATVALQGAVAWVDWNAYDLVSGVFAGGSGDAPDWGDGGGGDAEAGAAAFAGDALDASLPDGSAVALGPDGSPIAGDAGSLTGMPAASAIVGSPSFVLTPDDAAGPAASDDTGSVGSSGATGSSPPGAVDAAGATPPASGGASPSAPPGASPTPAAGEVPYWAKDGRLDVLVLGGDAGPGRDGLRTDSMMLVSVDIASGRAAIFGFPRNLVNVPLPPRIAKAYKCRCFPEMLSGYYRWAQSHPDLFTGSKTTRGYRAVAELYGYLTGRKIDGVAAADLNGFVKLVDALGGLRIDVPYRIYDRNYPKEDGSGTIVLEIKPGLQTLSGSLALAFARTRHQDSDYGRMSRQQLVLVALRKQMNPCAMLPRLPDLVKVAKESLWTNIPSAQLPSLLALAQHVDTKRITRVAFTPPKYQAYVTSADVSRMRAAIRDVFKGAPPAPDPDGEGFLHC